MSDLKTFGPVYASIVRSGFGGKVFKIPSSSMYLLRPSGEVGLSAPAVSPVPPSVMPSADDQVLSAADLDSVYADPADDSEDLDLDDYSSDDSPEAPSSSDQLLDKYPDVAFAGAPLVAPEPSVVGEFGEAGLDLEAGVMQPSAPTTSFDVAGDRIASSMIGASSSFGSDVVGDFGDQSSSGDYNSLSADQAVNFGTGVEPNNFQAAQVMEQTPAPMNVEPDASASAASMAAQGIYLQNGGAGFTPPPLSEEQMNLMAKYAGGAQMQPAMPQQNATRPTAQQMQPQMMNPQNPQVYAAAQPKPAAAQNYAPAAAGASALQSAGAGFTPPPLSEEQMNLMAKYAGGAQMQPAMPQQNATRPTAQQMQPQMMNPQNPQVYAAAQPKQAAAQNYAPAEARHLQNPSQNVA